MGVLLSPQLLSNTVSGPVLSDHFHEELVSHDGSSTAFTAPWDLDVHDTIVGIKNRDAAENWYILDGLNGYNKYYSTNVQGTQQTDSNVITVSGTSVTLGTTLSSANYIVTLYRAGSTGGESDSNGSITSTVSAGLICSIVTFTGNATSGATVGHRGAQDAQTPTYLRGKANNSGNSHVLYHSGLGNTKRLLMPNAVGVQTGLGFWNNTSPSSTLITLGNDSNHNPSGVAMTYYVFYDTDFSKAFSYTGDGLNPGPNILLGGEASQVTIRRGDTSYDSYFVYSAARDTANTRTEELRKELSSAEGTHTGDGIDINPTDIDIRSTDGGLNANTVTYVGFAYGDFS